MPIYLVERDLPGMTRDQLAAAHRALIQAASRFTAQGNPVRFVRKRLHAAARALYVRL
jgi:hypothetical protein